MPSEEHRSPTNQTEIPVPTKKKKLKLFWLKPKSTFPDEIATHGGSQAGLKGVPKHYALTRRFRNPPGKGHGFAAEAANTLVDRLAGRKASLIPETSKNGADRIVDGIPRQSKYYETAAKSVGACFENGRFKYATGDKPMQVEFPRDQHAEALENFKSRISKGQVPNVSDQAAAEDFVVRGNVTFQQAKNIALTETVEGIIYDTLSCRVEVATAFGVSAVISYAISIWQGEDNEKAISESAKSGFVAGFITLTSSVAANQIARTKYDNTLTTAAKWLVEKMDPKTIKWLGKGLTHNPDLTANAAKETVTNAVRTNIITATVATVVISSVDVYRAVKGRISRGQLFKNVAGKTAGVAGGTAAGMYGSAMGGTAGAALGSAIPGVGNVAGFVAGSQVGLFVGGMVGGVVSQKVTQGAIGLLIEDDAKAMSAILQEVAQQLIEDYILVPSEVAKLVESIKKKDMPAILREMFASKDRHLFAAHFLEGLLRPILESRSRVTLPLSLMISLPNPWWFESRVGRLLWRLKVVFTRILDRLVPRGRLSVSTQVK